MGTTALCYLVVYRQVFVETFQATQRRLDDCSKKPSEYYLTSYVVVIVEFNLNHFNVINKGPSQKPSQWFFRPKALKFFEILKFSGLLDLFSSGTYLLPMVGRYECYQFCILRNLRLTSKIDWKNITSL